MPDRHQLTDLQIAIMRVLWASGEATVASIWEALFADRKLAQTTVATVLARLEKRGIVAHRTQSRQFVYRALVSEEDVQHSMVNELTEQLFNGDVMALMSHLLNAKDVSPGDLARIRKMIDAVEAQDQEVVP
jgi:predicted transcriptional regulator